MRGRAEDRDVRARPMSNVEVFWVLVALVAIATALAVALMVVG
jgi:hypothetical protein